MAKPEKANMNRRFRLEAAISYVLIDAESGAFRRLFDNAALDHQAVGVRSLAVDVLQGCVIVGVR